MQDVVAVLGDFRLHSKEKFLFGSIQSSAAHSQASAGFPISSITATDVRRHAAARATVNNLRSLPQCPQRSKPDNKAAPNFAAPLLSPSYIA